MFFEFGDSVINTNAVSEIKAMTVDGMHKIVIFRMDGSFMASETFETANEVETRLSDILNGFSVNNILM